MLHAGLCEALEMQAACANALLMEGFLVLGARSGAVCSNQHLRNKDMREILDPPEDSKDSMAGACWV